MRLLHNSAFLGGGLPELHVRQTTALLLIDMQYLDAHPEHGIGLRAAEMERSEALRDYYLRLEDIVVPNLCRMLTGFRELKLTVAHARIACRRADCSDVGWRYEMLGLVVPPESPEARFLPGLEPHPGEPVFDKTTSSVFVSTDAHSILKGMGVDSIVMTGVATNSCVESSTRHAADLEYQVMLVGDGCAAPSRERHESTLRNLDRSFARVVTTESVLSDLASLPSDIRPR